MGQNGKGLYVYPSGISEVSKCMVRGENKANLTMIRRVIPSLQGGEETKGRWE